MTATLMTLALIATAIANAGPLFGAEFALPVIGGALLNRVAAQLDIDIDELAGRTEQKLLQDLEEAFADPMTESLPFRPDERRELVAQYPASAAALARMHRAYVTAVANADAYADRHANECAVRPKLTYVLTRRPTTR